MDNVRLIGAAMEKEEVQPGVMTVNDPLGDYLDIISFNEYVGWYDGDAEKCDRVNWQFSSDNGQKKKAFYVMQKWYRELTEAYK